MQFTDEHIYDAPVAVIRQMYYDTAFVPRKYRELGMRDLQVVETNGDAKDFFVCCNFVLEPSIAVPGFAKKLIGDGSIPVTWTDRWNTTTDKGSLEIVTHKFDSISLHADMSLEEHPRGAVNRFVWTVNCSMPLIGNKVAAYLAKDIQKKSAEDLAASVKILKDYLPDDQ